MKKKFLLVLSALLISACFGSEGEVAAKREGAKLTAEVLVRQLRENLKTRSLNEQQIYGEINGNKGAHLDPSTSAAAAQKLAEKSLQEWYAGEISRIFKTLNNSAPDATKGWFTDDEQSKLSSCPQDAVKSNLDNNFKSVYDKARNTACEEQRKRLVSGVYPTEEEVDSNDRNSLEKILLDRIVKNQAEPVFDENKNFIGKNLVDPILRDAENQLSGQKNVVQSSDGGPNALPPEITAFVKDQLSKLLEITKASRQKEKTPTKVYDAFPSVKGLVTKHAEEVAVKKFQDAISKTEFSPDPAWLKSLVKEDLKGHAKAERSKRICTAALKDRAKQEAVNQYAAKFPGSKEAVLKFVEKLLTENQDCVASVESLTVNIAGKILQPVRDEIANEQFQEFFGPLVSESWKPSEAEIESRYHSNNSNMDNPLRVEGISSKTFDTSSILEETAKKVTEAESKIMADAINQLRMQMNLVESTDGKIRGQLQSTANLPTVEELVTLFTEEVRKSWSHKKYVSLFGRPTEEIKRRAKDMLPLEVKRREEVEKKKKDDKIAEEKKKEVPPIPPTPPAIETVPNVSSNIGKGGNDTGEAKGGAGSGDKTGPGGGGTSGNAGGGAGGGTGSGPGSGSGSDPEDPQKQKRIPDLVIDFDNAEAVVNVKFFFPANKAETSFTIDTNQDVDTILASMDQQRQIFATWLDGLTESEKGKQVKVFILVRIFNTKVSYGSVFCVRECLEGVLNSKPRQNLMVIWYDRFCKPKDREIITIPKSVEKKKRNIIQF